MSLGSVQIAIIGLGYVGLPLAVEFGRLYPTIGFDINQGRVDALQSGVDKTKEVGDVKLNLAKHLTFTHNTSDLAGANLYIIAVPTPIDKNKRPDLDFLKSSTAIVAEYLNQGDVVIFESTVYPGCTEEVCVPILEEISDLRYNADFYCGYSPERVNPGDKLNTLTKVKKIVSGSTPEIADFVNELYASIVEAGTYKAESIKVAEAAKVIENCQRDINIAFVNELALIFELLELDTTSVLEAAQTKWNFLPFKPGLVGGHCIGVDPYYLTYKAQEAGYDPQVILSGRRINDAMGAHIAKRIVKQLVDKGFILKNVNALILGITFKENITDIRNSKAYNVYKELTDFGLNVSVYDTWADPKEVKEVYGIDLISDLNSKYEAIVLAVPHNDFQDIEIQSLSTSNAVIFDVKSFFPKEQVTDRL